MGVEVAVRGASEAELTEVRALFAERDCAFSRFRADSELTHVNRAAGLAVVVSPLFARMLRTALAAASRTGGLVDPTLGAALEAAGYDRDFDRLEDDPRRAGPPFGGARVGPARRAAAAATAGASAGFERRRQGGDGRRRARPAATAGVRRGRGRRRRSGRRRRRPAGRRDDSCPRGRGRHERNLQAGVAPGQRAPAPPDRPGDGTAVAFTLDRRHRGRGDVPRRRRRRQGRVPARRRRSRLARRARPARPLRRRRRHRPLQRGLRRALDPARATLEVAA